MPNENDPEPQNLPASAADSSAPLNSQDETVEPYEPPELVKYDQLGKLIVSGE